MLPFLFLLKSGYVKPIALRFLCCPPVCLAISSPWGRWTAICASRSWGPGGPAAGTNTKCSSRDQVRENLTTRRPGPQSPGWTT